MVSNSKFDATKHGRLDPSQAPRAVSRGLPCGAISWQDYCHRWKHLLIQGVLRLQRAGVITIRDECQAGVWMSRLMWHKHISRTVRAVELELEIQIFLFIKMYVCCFAPSQVRPWMDSSAVHVHTAVPGTHTYLVHTADQAASLVLVQQRNVLTIEYIQHTAVFITTSSARLCQCTAAVL